MKLRWLLLLLVCFVIAADDVPDDMVIQGSWNVVGFDQNGKSLGDSVKAAGLKIIFKDKNVSYQVKGADAPESGTFVLDPTKNPKAIDTTDKRGATEKGIYKLEGDKLTLCFAEAGKDKPPTEFKTESGDGKGGGHRLFMLVRDKDAKDKEKEKEKEKPKDK